MTDTTAAAMTIEGHWHDLVTAALLGADRRDPPPPPPALADLVADALPEGASARLRVQVAACAAVRRGAFLPSPPRVPLDPPGTDPRPMCSRAAVDRWHHIVTSWPVLEDEWMIVLVASGRRLAPELVPEMLRRHRRDSERRTRVFHAAGDLARWLVEHVPDLGPGPSSQVDDPFPDRLPDLPIAVELQPLLDERPEVVGQIVSDVVVEGLERGELVNAHRNVLVNLLARVDPAGLVELAARLDRVDGTSIGHPIATVLADLAATRRRMLDELHEPGEPPIGSPTGRSEGRSVPDTP